MPATAGAKNMVWIPGGEFTMGSDAFYPEEQPVHRVAVDGFWMDESPVTVADFRRFVKATGHVTAAEIAPTLEEYPDADPALLTPGSLCFVPSAGPVDLRDYRNWWTFEPGAQWRHPEGPPSSVNGRDRHPVTHLDYADVAAYLAWAGKELPTEAEWEHAACGGLDAPVFAWGDEFAPAGRMMANTWQGEFPWQNLLLDGYDRTSPIKTFPPNGHGLYDMTGNVWEWTCDFFTPRHPDAVDKPCCTPRNPRVREADDSFDVGMPGAQTPRRVIKGGSHLCAPNYCLRYRPAARQAEAEDTSTCHIGFRGIIRARRTEQHEPDEPDQPQDADLDA